MLAIQLLRFCLIFKDILFLKKFFLLLKMILIKSAPIITLFGLVLFFYSLIGNKIFFSYISYKVYLGVYLFSYLKPQKTINDDINFTSIFSSMFTLFRVATGERWFLILADCSRKTSVDFVCTEISDFYGFQRYGQVDCGSQYAYPFFYSFYIIILLIMNLLVGVMINVSGSIRKYQERAISLYQLDDITKLWAEFDTEGYGFMNYKDFWKFSSKIAKILGVKSEEFLDLKSKQLFLKILELPVYEYSGHNLMFCFSFHEVVLALSKIAVIIKLNITNMDLDLPGNKLKIVINESKTVKKTKYTSQDIAVIMNLQSNIRQWKKKALDIPKYHLILRKFLLF